MSMALCNTGKRNDSTAVNHFMWLFFHTRVLSGFHYCRGKIERSKNSSLYVTDKNKESHRDVLNVLSALGPLLFGTWGLDIEMIEVIHGKT